MNLPILSWTVSRILASAGSSNRIVVVELNGFGPWSLQPELPRTTNRLFILNRNSILHEQCHWDDSLPARPLWVKWCSSACIVSPSANPAALRVSSIGSELSAATSPANGVACRPGRGGRQDEKRGCLKPNLAPPDRLGKALPQTNASGRNHPLMAKSSGESIIHG